MSRIGFIDMLLRDAAALVIVKATVVLALATGAAAVAKGFSAARRHMVWLVALLSCVWLVLSSPVVPAIMIHTSVLPQRVVTAPRGPTASAHPSSQGTPTTNASRAPERFPAIEALQRSSTRSIPLPSHPLIALWIIGFVVLLARHTLGLVRTARLARNASIANDDETARELADVIASVGVRREVRLAYSVEVRTPITAGVAKPYVLLPIDAKSWPIERRKAVLVHEVAHIARGDWLSQAIGQLACELFWFHPLAWRAFAHLRDEAERAADDCVLRSGMPASEYATHLLALAQRSSNARSDLVAVGIVSTNDIERRFVAMFDTKRSRTIVTARARAIATGVALAVVCPLAALRVAAPSHQMTAPQMHAPLRHELPAQLSTPQPVGATRAAIVERNTARVTRTADVGTTIVNEPAPKIAPETWPASIPVVDHPVPSPIGHPDLSGTWKVVSGSSEGPFVNDSLIIRQYGPAISFESRGHRLDTLTYVQVHEVWFDGAESPAFTVTGERATSFSVSAIWVVDTLVLTSHAQKGGHVYHIIERMTLGPDGNTLIDTNRSFVDGQADSTEPFTSVSRRLAP